MKYKLRNEAYPVGQQISFYHDVVIVKEEHIVETDNELTATLLKKSGFVEVGKKLEKEIKKKKKKKKHGKLHHRTKSK